MLDDIREWISDYLRYILLVVAGILILVIAFFAVRLVTSLGAKQERTKEEVSESEMETVPESEAKHDLVRNQQDMLDLVTSFYTARLNKDYDTLGRICEVMDDNVRAVYEAQDTAIESYSNIMTYSKEGLEEGSQIVFAYFDVKLTGIDTLVPAIRGLYVTKNEEGNYIISDLDSHPDEKAYLEQVWTDDDVQALREDVSKKYNDSVAQDPDLAAYVDALQTEGGGNASGAGEGTDGSGDGTGEEGSGTTDGTLGTMYASTGVNVRGTPSADATLYGTLQTGMEVEVLENLDSGWSRIRYYSTDGTPVEGYVMTQYLTAG